MEENQNQVQETKTKNQFSMGLLVGLLIGVLGFGAIFGAIRVGNLLVGRFTNSSVDNVIDNHTLNKIKSVQKIINNNFYKYNDTVTTENLEDGIIQGMIDSLKDPYAEYFSTKEIKEVMDGYEGVSYGIGCYVSIDDNNMPVIAGTIEGSPAEAAELREGDIIVAVNGEPTQGLRLSQVVELIKGPENTEVEITFNRDGEFFEMTLVRGKLIEKDTVTYGTIVDNEDIGYIRISEFDEVTYNQYKDAFADLKSQDVKGLILDLRSNPGGDMNTAVDIAREILPAGLVVYTEDNKGNRKEYTCKGDKELDIPLTVLINAYSASASEILAGAIQDYNKGTIIGTTSYGKGIVQKVINLADGSAIKITANAYFTPNGRNIHGIGIEPDIELEYDFEAAEKTGDDNQVNKAIEVLRQKIGE